MGVASSLGEVAASSVAALPPRRRLSRAVVLLLHRQRCWRDDDAPTSSDRHRIPCEEGSLVR